MGIFGKPERTPEEVAANIRQLEAENARLDEEIERAVTPEPPRKRELFEPPILSAKRLMHEWQGRTGPVPGVAACSSAQYVPTNFVQIQRPFGESEAKAKIILPRS